MKTISNQTELLTASNYREFMRLIIEGRKGQIWGAYTAISKKAGFSSRTFVRDIVSGKRRITAKTLPAIANAMGLKGDLKNYFELLVYLEELDFRPAELNSVKIAKRLEKLKDKILKRGAGAIEPSSAQWVSKKYWVETYAALGTFKSGASLDEVVKRTGKAPAIVQDTLDAMCVANIIKKDDQLSRYFALSSHVVSQAWDGMHRQYFLESIQGATSRAKASFASPDRLYWKSVFSMRKENATPFKTELRELILRFVDSAEDPEGDTLGHITIAFESGI